MNHRNKINVTRSFLPPKEEYEGYLNRIWETNWVTNRGSLTRELEQKLIEKLEVNQIVLTSNGTVPIQIALKALKISGEVITTPFSYVATTSSIVWEHCTPIFVDINPDYLTIDEDKIEASISSKTTAILVTHVFGNPCDVEKIASIAKKHNLKVIYDAAHCFGVRYKGKSIFQYGDISTCSFHATKLFHTGEGGCMVANDKEIHDKLFYHHNFGHDGPEKFHGIGINAKLSEFHSAMGLSVLPYIDQIIEERKKLSSIYDKHLNFSILRKPIVREGTEWNYGYYPVIFQSEEQLLRVKEALNKNDIYPRRYFYPSLNTLPYVSYSDCEKSEQVSKTILCLPFYNYLKDKEVELISEIICQNL